MSFSFEQDYFELAASLAVTASDATDETRAEALARASASRAYYAAFHAAQRKVVELQREHDPFFDPRKSKDRPHDRVWETYARAGRPLAAIGTTGRELKQLRRHADYDSPPRFTVEKAGLAIDMAKKVANLLAALKPADVALLARYLARTPL